jgi:hypothetical protein
VSASSVNREYVVFIVSLSHGLYFPVNSSKILYFSLHVTGGIFAIIFLGIVMACITIAFEYWWYKYKRPPRVADTAIVVVPAPQIPTAGGSTLETETTLQDFSPRNPAYPGHTLRWVPTVRLLQMSTCPSYNHYTYTAQCGQYVHWAFCISFGMILKRSLCQGKQRLFF